MKRIGLISDTHGFLDPKVFELFKNCDEIWHAGDIGRWEVIEELEAFKPLRAVYGNIDGGKVRQAFEENLFFICEEARIWITHIGGYPGRYNKRIRDFLSRNRAPDLFICGHSHILKVTRDKKYDFLHLNPGAMGHIGFHKIRTALRFGIEKGKIINLEAIELGPRGK